MSGIVVPVRLISVLDEYLWHYWLVDVLTLISLPIRSNSLSTLTSISCLISP